MKKKAKRIEMKAMKTVGAYLYKTGIPELTTILG